MTNPTLVLIHGVMHGPWCFDLLRQPLADRGIPTIALEMPLDTLAGDVAVVRGGQVPATPRPAPEGLRRSPDRANANVHELPGDHSPFLARPDALVEILTEIILRNAA